MNSPDPVNSPEPEPPPELVDLDGLEARLVAWKRHTLDEYSRAELALKELRSDRRHVEAQQRVDRWLMEHERVRRLLEMLTRSKQSLSYLAHDGGAFGPICSSITTAVRGNGGGGA